MTAAIRSLILLYNELIAEVARALGHATAAQANWADDRLFISPRTSHGRVETEA